MSTRNDPATFNKELTELAAQFARELPGWWFVTGVFQDIAWARAASDDRPEEEFVLVELQLPATRADALRDAMRRILARTPVQRTWS